MSSEAEFGLSWAAILVGLPIFIHLMIKLSEFISNIEMRRAREKRERK